MPPLSCLMLTPFLFLWNVLVFYLAGVNPFSDEMTLPLSRAIERVFFCNHFLFHVSERVQPAGPSSKEKVVLPRSIQHLFTPVKGAWHTHAHAASMTKVVQLQQNNNEKKKKHFGVLRASSIDERVMHFFAHLNLIVNSPTSL